MDRDSEIVEAMARALYERMPIRSGGSMIEWGQIPSAVRSNYAEDATAALAAYRNATGDDGK